MKKSILVAAVLAFALTNAGPASAVRDKQDKALKGANSKAAAVSSDRGVQSKAGAQSKASTAQASKAAAAGAKSNAAK